MRLFGKEKGKQFWGTFWVFILFSSFWATASIAQEKGVLWVDRFSQGVDAGGIPGGWILEKTPGANSKIAVGQDQGKFFLQLLSVEDSFGVRKEISFDIRKFPYLFWQWKVAKLPRGGDIRKRETDDEAGQIYVLFPRFPTMVNTRSVGYIWDSQAPTGLFGTSTAYSKMRYVVLESGASRLNQWVSETRNVYEDYKKLFEEEPPTVGSLLLYINSQHTKSSAECFYADIFFSSSPPDTPKK